MTRNRIDNASSSTIIKGNIDNRKFLKGMFSLIMILLAPVMIKGNISFFKVFFYFELLSTSLNIETEIL